MIEAMGDGLADADRGRQDARAAPRMSARISSREARRGLEIDIDLAEMNALRRARRVSARPVRRPTEAHVRDVSSTDARAIKPNWTSPREMPGL